MVLYIVRHAEAVAGSDNFKDEWRYLTEKGGCVALKVDPEKRDRSADFLWCLAPGKKRTTSFKKAFPQR